MTQPEPTHLYFIRHAATALAGTFCGSTNPPLNEVGQAQLPPLLKLLAGKQIDAVYTSDLLRATQTAAPLAAQHNAPIILRPALRELHFGDWESLTWDQIEQRDKPYATRWVTEFPNLPTPNGEPIATFRTRILTEIEFLRRQAATQNIAVVTHAGPLRVLLEELAHYTPQHAWERTRDYTTLIPCAQTRHTFTIL